MSLLLLSSITFNYVQFPSAAVDLVRVTVSQSIQLDEESCKERDTSNNTFDHGHVVGA